MELKEWVFVSVGIVILGFVISVLVGTGMKDKLAETEKVILEDESLFVSIISKTEYVPFDEGQVIVELMDRQFNKINASCKATVLYPDKTIFINDEPMLETILGTKYINFTIPIMGGVFEYSVNCSYNGKSYMDGSSFHVSKGRLKAWVER